MPETDQKKIGIIGAGMIGAALAKHFARLGHPVFIANSRGPDTLMELAADIGATAVTAREAARLGDIVIVTIPMKHVELLPRDLFAATGETAIIIDTGNYYPARDGQISALNAGMVESQWVSEQLGRPLVKAFNNISFLNLGAGGLPAGSPGRIALSVAGDDPVARAVVMEMIDAIGFDPVDAGVLEESWRQQPGTPAYCHDLGYAALKTALAAAEKDKLPEYRIAANDFAKRFLAGEVTL